MIVQPVIFLCISTESLIFSIYNGADVLYLLKLSLLDLLTILHYLVLYISVDAEHQILLILLHHHL
jgi:hypothetical protein